MNISNTFEHVDSEPQTIPVVGESLKFLSDRMAKITQAVVLITSVVRDSYGLTRDLVGYATRAMTHVNSLEFRPEHATFQDVVRVNVALRQIMNTCELCHAAGLVSDMNYTILMQELKSVNQFVHEKLETYCIGHVAYPFRVPEIESGVSNGQQTPLESFFTKNESSEKNSTPGNGSEHKTISSSKQVEEKHINESRINASIVGQSKEIHKSIQSPVVLQKSPFLKPVSHDESFSERNQLVVKPISGEDKKERRDAIMKTIRSKGQVTIRDISKNIRGCSEKTIQRDLQELIQHGVLIREGEKRWAVYKLAMNNV